ncbi:MAG: hypothetical protein AAGE65_14445 [Planctomycetota bacterium]
MLSLMIAFAWAWFVLGIVSGAVLGLGFARADFMGGYGGWRRRLARLGHVSFFGTGGLVLAAALTAAALSVNGTPMSEAGLRFAGACLGVGGVAMPTVCFLSAWRKPWRHLFFVPVLGLSGGVAALTWSAIGVAL